MSIILNIFSITIQAYFAFYTISWIIRLVVANFYFTKVNSTQVKHSLKNELVILLPAYKANETFISVLDSIFANGAKHKVFVLFQNTEKEIIHQAQRYPIYWEEKSFEEIEGNPYHAALNYATKKLKVLSNKEGFNLEYLVLLDKDNILHNDFLRHIETGIYMGNDVVQGVRIPHKQFTTPSEAYDIISELLNDNMYRKSNMQLFNYLELSGSGFAIRFNMFEKAVKILDRRAPGMDKNLLIQLLINFPKIRMNFIPEAKVYDEKTSDIKVLQQQRTRWFGNQYFNAFYYTGELIKSTLHTGNFAPINYAITLFRPPRSILLFILLSFSCVDLFFLNNHFWAILLYLFVIINIQFLYKNKLFTESIKIIKYLPKISFNNIKAVIKGSSRKQQGKFIHTLHK